MVSSSSIFYVIGRIRNRGVLFFYSLYNLQNDKKNPIGSQPMNQGVIQVTNLSIVGSTHNHFKTQVQVCNNHEKGVLNFLMLSSSTCSFFQFSMKLNHKQCINTIYNSCSNQYHKKNNHAQENKKLSWENPSQTREKPNNPLL
jgi:hypothetical protein